MREKVHEVRAPARIDLAGGTLDDASFLRHGMDMEARVIAAPTGAQDYVAAMHGGLSAIRYPPGGPHRDAIPCDLDALARRIVLVDTAAPHHSATNNWEIT